MSQQGRPLFRHEDGLNLRAHLYFLARFPLAWKTKTGLLLRARNTNLPAHSLLRCNAPNNLRIKMGIAAAAAAAQDDLIHGWVSTACGRGDERYSVAVV